MTKELCWKSLRIFTSSDSDCEVEELDDDSGSDTEDVDDSFDAWLEGTLLNNT